MPRTADRALSNYLLRRLPRHAREDFVSKLEPVSLAHDQLLHEANGPITHVYFPASSVISLLAVVDGIARLEVGMVGREGMVGVSLALGRTRSLTRAIASQPGLALRMAARRYRAECNRHPEIVKSLLPYQLVRVKQAMQCAAYSHTQSGTARVARWLLMARRRTRGNSLLATQESLARMLGMKRERVNAVARELKDRGLVDYVRGRIVLRNLRRLETLARIGDSAFDSE